MKWGKRTFGGNRYDLTHLDPCDLVVPQAEDLLALKVRVEFGAHVFTQSWKDGDSEDFKFMDGGTPRRFCPDRHAHSVHLPGIIERSVDGRVLLSPQRKFIVLGNPPGASFPYAVFFTMRQGGKFDALVDVVSAHERPRLQEMPGVSFAELTELIASGRFQWPKRK
jgi:hypothetical protein